MLATILLLAQLVLPGPPSGPIQPPGMICLGECAGPVVWGPAERGRLVVACDMTSDTCSDGRRIITQRATPVPCETSPGVWEMVGVDEGCYSVRGLESWAATTTYLSYGAELDRSPWDGAATAARKGSIYSVCAESGNLFRQQLASEEGGVVRAAACRVRAGTSNSIRLLAADVSSGGVNYDYTLTSEWQTVTATATIVAGGGVAGVRIHPARAGAGCIDVAGCWSVRGDTPGRACWGGEAPVTCGADRHTISTEGWPTTEGEIRMVVELNEQLVAGRNAWLFDGRDAANLIGVNPYIQPDGRLRFRVAGTVHGSASPILTWEVGRPYALRFLRKGGQTFIYRDGALVYSVVTPDWAWAPSAHLGMNFSLTGPDVAIAIRALTVRSYEEVSP